ncbi:MAG: hypothetical protein JSV19_03840 [Phycisphaerales bacterium]|nr:MAG: hypothetical protein JSV19_03840 [Phycisphaerales bacterium]
MPGCTGAAYSGDGYNGAMQLECVRQVGDPPTSQRIAEVRLTFGLPTANAPGGVNARASANALNDEDVGERWILHPVSVRLGPGRIVAFVGPSGSGKTAALEQIKARLPGAHTVSRTVFPTDRSVVDAVCAQTSLAEALALLSACALSEAPLWLRRFNELSDGQRFRAKLARALGLHARGRSPAPLLCDEFCSGLHRRAAKAVAFNLRKLVTRKRLSVVIAAGNDDILPDLQPDTTVRLLGNGHHEKTERKPRPRAISFHRRLRIERARKADYDRFAQMHYRRTDELGFVDKVFVLREGLDGDCLGIVVYAHGPIELSLRNRATRGRFRGRPDRLNRDMRILRRLVVHPDVRGCGLGHMLVRKTLPLVGTRYVECLASMGTVNPVFERAGMRRIGLCSVPPQQTRTLEALRRMGVDPFARDFAVLVCRRRRVRAVITEFVRRWYQATTGRGDTRVARQSSLFLARTFRALIGSRPVYYLWQREAA